MSAEIENKILKLAQESVKEKVEIEKAQLEKKIEREMEDLKFVLELINKKMLYKKITEYGNIKGYELITEDIFLKDYLARESSPRLQICEYTDYSFDFLKLRIKVNNQEYFHIGNIINDFENELKKKKDKIEYISKSLWEIEKDFKDFSKKEPIIKKMVEDYLLIDKSLNSESIE